MIKNTLSKFQFGFKENLFTQDTITQLLTKIQQTIRQQ